jgi:hypothetical protein
MNSAIYFAGLLETGAIVALVAAFILTDLGKRR